MHMRIADVKKKFKNTWVLAEVLKMNKLNEPTEVRPIMANKDRDKVYEGIAKVSRNKTVTTIYTGKITGNFLF